VKKSSNTRTAPEVLVVNDVDGGATEVVEPTTVVDERVKKKRYRAHFVIAEGSFLSCLGGKCGSSW